MTASVFRNYINGEWVAGETFENRNPANTDEVVGLFAKGTARDMADAAGAAQAAFPAWSSLPAPARGAYLFKVAEILDRKFDADRRRDDQGGRQDAAGIERRGAAVHQHLPLLRRRGRAHAGPAGAVRARPRPHFRHPQAPGRRRADHAVEFPERHPGLEARAGLDRGQHRGAEAGQRRSAQRVADRGGLPRSGHSQRRGQLRRRPRRGAGPGPDRRRPAQGRLVYGFLPDRPVAACRGVEAAAQDSARDGRQESDHRAGGRRFQCGGRECRERRLRFHRPEMHRHQPRHRRGADLRPLRGRAGRSAPKS